MDEPRPTPYVLVVDDNLGVARALDSVLKNAGYDAVVFNSGTPALQYARQHTPAIAVVDIHLPDISGLILTRELREHLGPDRPIIVLSGDPSMENLNSLSHVGATYFFSKPLKASQLVETIRQLVA